MKNKDRFCLADRLSFSFKIPTRLAYALRTRRENNILIYSCGLKKSSIGCIELLLIHCITLKI